MDKEQITQELKSLKDRIAEIEQSLEDDPETVEGIRLLPFNWKPRIGDSYHHLDGEADLDESIWDGHEIDLRRHAIGNVFPTKEMAERHKRHLIAVATFNRLCGRHPNGRCEIDSDGDTGEGDSYTKTTLRRIDDKDILAAIKEEFLDSGCSIDDLFMYAMEERP
jgi:hypothetical protein